MKKVAIINSMYGNWARREKYVQIMDWIFLIFLVIFILCLGTGQISLKQWGIPFSIGGTIWKVFCWPLFFYLLGKGLRKDYSMIKTPLNLWIGLLALWIVAVVPSHADQWKSAEDVFFFLLYLLCFYLAADGLHKKDQLQKVILTLLVSGCMAVCIGFYYMLVMHKVYDSYRLLSPLDHPNRLGGFLILTIPIAAALFLERSQGLKNRLMHLMFTIIMVVGLVLTYSRSSWLGFLVATVVISIFRFKKKWIFFTAVFLLSVVMLVSSVFWIAPKSSLANRIRTFKSPIEDSALLSRIKAWPVCLKIITDHPLTGVGTGTKTFKKAYLQYKDGKKETALSHAHNFYIQIAIYFGLPSLALFLTLILVFFKDTIRTIHITQEPYSRAVLCGILASIAGFLVHNLAENRLWTTQTEAMFWLLLGMSFAVRRINGKNR